MKLLLSLMAMAMAVGFSAQANDDMMTLSAASAKKAQAQRFAKDLPGTLVVRRDAAGNVAVYHSATHLKKGERLNYDPRFQSNFATHEVPMNGLTYWGSRGLGGLGGLFNFFWNVADAASYPTYSYYNPGYDYSYNYAYSPYYNYYDPYGYTYSYYSWL